MLDKHAHGYNSSIKHVKKLIAMELRLMNDLWLFSISEAEKSGKYDALDSVHVTNGEIVHDPINDRRVNNDYMPNVPQVNMGYDSDSSYPSDRLWARETRAEICVNSDIPSSGSITFHEHFSQFWYMQTFLERKICLYDKYLFIDILIYKMPLCL